MTWHDSDTTLECLKRGVLFSACLLVMVDVCGQVYYMIVHFYTHSTCMYSHVLGLILYCNPLL